MRFQVSMLDQGLWAIVSSTFLSKASLQCASSPQQIQSSGPLLLYSVATVVVPSPDPKANSSLSFSGIANRKSRITNRKSQIGKSGQYCDGSSGMSIPSPRRPDHRKQGISQCSAKVPVARIPNVPSTWNHPEKIAKQRYVQNVWDSAMWRDMAVLISLFVVVFGYPDLVVKSLPKYWSLELTASHMQTILKSVPYDLQVDTTLL